MTCSSVKSKRAVENILHPFVEITIALSALQSGISGRFDG
jgi:hypothetical protein